MEGPYDIQGSKMYIDDKDSLELRKNGIYENTETNIIRSILNYSDVVLDLGANIGYFTLIMAKQCKYVFSFEPDPINYNILSKNIELNKVENVELYQYAIGENIGKIDLHLCEFNTGMHRIYKSQYCKGGIIKVNMTTIDKLISDGIITDNIKFIKMDLEGSEFGALRGMKNLLEERKPTVLMEFHPLGIEEYKANPEEQYNFMKNFGYKITLTLDPLIEIKDYKELDYYTRYSPARNILCQ